MADTFQVEMADGSQVTMSAADVELKRGLRAYVAELRGWADSQAPGSEFVRGVVATTREIADELERRFLGEPEAPIRVKAAFKGLKAAPDD